MNLQKAPVDLEFTYAVDIDLPDFTVTLPFEDARRIKEYISILLHRLEEAAKA